MPTPTTVRNALRHPVTLASGRPLAPGDQTDADLSDPHDSQLVDDGVLTVVPKPTPKRRKPKTQEESA